jgi:hypothetical protein
MFRNKTLDVFYHVAAVLLVITGLAKLVSSFGTAGIIDYPDPVFSISFRSLMRGVAVVELLVACVCFYGRNDYFRAACVSVLATNFLLYRIANIWMGYHNLCRCLGNLTDALHIRPNHAEIIVKIILGYLLVVGFGTLFSLLRRRNIPATIKGNDLL